MATIAGNGLHTSSLGAGSLHSGSLRGAAARTLVANLAGLAVTLVAHAWLARTLGTDAYGQFALAIALATVVSAVARFGWDGAAYRFVPGYLTQGDGGRLTGFLVAARARVRLLATALATCLMLLGTLGLLPGLRVGNYLAVAVLVVAQTGLLWQAACTRASGAAAISQLVVEVVRPLLLVVCCVALVNWSGVSLSATRVLVLYAAATVASGLALTLVNRQLFVYVRGPRNSDELALWQRTARPLAAASILELLYDQADVLLVGGMLGSQAAGSYALAARLAKLPLAATSAVSMSAVPRLSAAQAQGDWRVFTTVSRKASTGMLAGAVCASIAVLVGAPVGLRWLGGDYADATWPLLVLLLGRCTAAAYGPAMQTLSVVGQARGVPVYLGIGLAIQVSLGAISLMSFGTVGGAASRSMATIACAFLANATLRRAHSGEQAVLPLPPMRRRAINLLANQIRRQVPGQLVVGRIGDQHRAPLAVEQE
ncbi:MAG: oligosaccharide flippase family protein [Pirellulales bacterium]|nr:oligosaccharide flippase family protein [Pirellulales bacterium]